MKATHPGRMALPGYAAALALWALLPGAARAAEGTGVGALRVHGQLDLTAATQGDVRAWNWDEMNTSAFDPYIAHLQAEDRLSPHFEVDGHVWYREATGLRLMGAYVQYTPAPAHDLHLVAGKIPWFIGTYGERAYPDQNALVGTPMLYQFKAGLSWYSLPASAAALVKPTPGNSAYGPSPYSAGGMPVVWESWWDSGIMAVGSARPLEGSFGVVQGTPGWAEPGEDPNHGKTVLGRVGVMPVPAVRVGVSGALGPYLVDGIPDSLLAGKRVEDYDQKLALVDAQLELGHAEARGEGYRNVWESPRLGNLRASGYYVEGKYTLPTGLYAAARWEIMRFSKVDVGGIGETWRADQDRFECGLGYRVSRGVLAKVVFQRQLSHADGPSVPSESDALGAAQLVVRF